jgi:hypothetical protein
MDRQTGEGAGYGTQTEAASGNRQAGRTQHVDPPGIAVAVMTHPITKSSTALARVGAIPRKSQRHTTPAGRQ